MDGETFKHTREAFRRQRGLIVMLLLLAVVAWLEPTFSQCLTIVFWRTP